MSTTTNIPISATSLRDRINNASTRETAKSASGILNHLQHYSQDTQITGAAVVFLTLARRFNLHPPDLLTAVDNMMKDARRYDDASFQGIQDYFNNEI